MNSTPLVLEIEPHDFQRLKGKERERALALLNMEQELFVARQYEIQNATKEKLDFWRAVHTFHLKENLKLILKARGVQRFSALIGGPFKKEGPSLRAKLRKVNAHVFDEGAYITDWETEERNKAMHFFIGLLRQSKEPPKPIYRVNKKLFHHLYQKKLDT